MLLAESKSGFVLRVRECNGELCSVQDRTRRAVVDDTVSRSRDSPPRYVSPSAIEHNDCQQDGHDDNDANDNEEPCGGSLFDVFVEITP
jgi:hypothetical protein